MIEVVVWSKIGTKCLVRWCGAEAEIRNRGCSYWDAVEQIKMVWT